MGSPSKHSYTPTSAMQCRWMLSLAAETFRHRLGWIGVTEPEQRRAAHRRVVAAIALDAADLVGRHQLAIPTLEHRGVGEVDARAYAEDEAGMAVVHRGQRDCGTSLTVVGVSNRP